MNAVVMEALRVRWEEIKKLPIIVIIFLSVYNYFIIKGSFCISKKTFFVILIFFSILITNLILKSTIKNNVTTNSQAYEVLPIISGQSAKLGEFPYFVYIKMTVNKLLFNTSPPGIYYITSECGGVLIDKQ